MDSYSHTFKSIEKFQMFCFVLFSVHFFSIPFLRLFPSFKLTNAVLFFNCCCYKNVYWWFSYIVKTIDGRWNFHGKQKWKKNYKIFAFVCSLSCTPWKSAEIQFIVYTERWRRKRQQKFQHLCIEIIDFENTFDNDRMFFFSFDFPIIWRKSPFFSSIT